MNFINKILNYKNFKIKLFLLFTFIIVWTSVGSSYNNLLIFYSNESITISKIINFFRVVLIFLIFPILSFLFIKILVMTNSFRLKENFLIYSVFIYFFLHLPGLFYTNNSIENLIYVVSAINFLIILSLSMKIFKYNEVLILIYCVFIILFSILIYAFSSDLMGFFLEDQISKKFYGQLHTIFENNSIRSSGTSRFSLILLVIYMIILQKHINSKILKEIPIFIFSTIIFLYESRAVILLLALILIVDLFFKMYEKKFFYNLIKYFIFYLMLPLLLSLQINDQHAHYRLYEYQKKKAENIFMRDRQLFKTKLYNYSLSYIPIYSSYTALDNFNYLNIFDKILEVQNSSSTSTYSGNKNELQTQTDVTLFCKVITCLDDTNRLTNTDILFTTSGRFNDWKEIFHRYDYNALILGYGSQGDRYLINQTASNAVIYAFSSTGIIGLIFFIFFSFVISLRILKFFLLKKIDEPLIRLSAFILIIIFVRSLIESSYAVFGVDFMLFSLSLFLLDKYNKTLA